MPRYGLLIDYEYCTGCHTCEVACQQEHGFPSDKFGIKLSCQGPWQIAPEKWQYDFIPVPTDLCNLCRQRVQKGKQPACVHHCQAQVMQFGTVEELSSGLGTKGKQVLFVLG